MFTVKLAARYPVTVDSLMVIRPQKDGLSLGIPQFHLRPELRKRPKDLQLEPSPQLRLHIDLLKDLIYIRLTIGQRLTQGDQPALPHLLLKDHFLIIVRIHLILLLILVPGREIP